MCASSELEIEILTERIRSPLLSSPLRSAGPPAKMKETKMPSPSSPPTILKPNPVEPLCSNTFLGSLPKQSDSVRVKGRTESREEVGRGREIWPKLMYKQRVTKIHLLLVYIVNDPLMPSTFSLGSDLLNKIFKWLVYRTTHKKNYD